ncbi:MAG: hypothetical protein ACI8XU_000677 [Kiritimatiellia bacterium]|jgi:hypothetical protein
MVLCKNGCKCKFAPVFLLLNNAMQNFQAKALLLYFPVPTRFL